MIRFLPTTGPEWVCEQARTRQALVDDGDRRVADRHMVVTFLASVLETNMLPDKQTRRLVVELLADVLAELDAHLVATRALPLGLTQRVLDTLAWQILGQRLAAMSLAFGFAAVGAFFDRRLGSRRCRRVGRRVRRQFGQEPGLMGIETFRFGTVEFSQQQIETLPHAFVIVPRLLECVE